MKGNIHDEKAPVCSFLKRYLSISVSSIVIILSIVFFLIYRNFEISRVTNASLLSLSQFSRSSDSLFDTIRASTFQIYEDSDINRLINGTQLSLEEINRIYTRLRYYASGITSIGSVYVYSAYTETFYTTYEGYPKQSQLDFFDTYAVDFLAGSVETVVMNPIPRKITLPHFPYTVSNVYTFIYSGSPREMREGTFNKAVFVNIPEEWLRDSLDIWNSHIRGSICIIDGGGSLVSSVNGGVFLQDVSETHYIGTILDSDADSGYLVDTVNGTKTIITYVHSKKLGWYFIRFTPYAVIYDSMKKIGLMTAAILLINIAAGLMLSYYVAGRTRAAIDKMINKLKKQVEENKTELSKLKNEFLYGCLRGKPFEPMGNIGESFGKLEIGILPEQDILLVLFRLDHYRELCGKHPPYDLSILRQGLMNTISNVISREYPFETADCGDDHVALICNDRAMSENEIGNLIRAIQERSAKKLQLSLSATVGPSGYAFGDIGLVYREARMASNYRLFEGHGCVIFTDQIKKAAAKEFSYPSSKEKRLFDALMTQNIDSAKCILEKIVDATADYPYTVLNSLLLRLVSSVSAAFESIESIGKYAIDYDFNSFLSQLNGCETIAEIKAEFYGMFDQIDLILEDKKKSKYDQIVNRVYEIIRQHYSDENLCLNNIAALVKLSPRYLGNLFKTYTSRSVSEVINDVRMKKAAELLEESALSISKISRKIGFPSSNYFYLVFKKTYGATPAEYRKRKEKPLYSVENS